MLEGSINNNISEALNAKKLCGSLSLAAELNRAIIRQSLNMWKERFSGRYIP